MNTYSKADWQKIEEEIAELLFDANGTSSGAKDIINYPQGRLKPEKGCPFDGQLKTDNNE